MQTIQKTISQLKSSAKLHLSPEPEIITCGPGLFMYLERLGPFDKNAPLAWQDFVWLTSGHLDENNIASGISLSRIDKTKKGDAAFIYQAGVLLYSSPQEIIKGLKLRALPGGKYASFILRGPYSLLSVAFPACFKILRENCIHVREDFCMEKYLNKPSETPESELQTELLIPVH